MPDEIVQTMPGPALSATADTPDVQAPPPPLSASGMDAPADPPAPDTTDPVDPPADPVDPPADPAPADPEPIDPPADPEPAPVEAKPEGREDKGVGKKLNKLETDLDAERKRADALQAQLNDALIAKIKAAETPAPAPAEEVKPDLKPLRPRASQFETPDAHEAALDAYDTELAAWTTRQAETKAKAVLNADKAIEQQQAAAAKAGENFATVEAAHMERITKATEKHADFAEVAFANDVPISPSMGILIMNSDVGPDIMYHLGQNKAEAARIASMVIPGQFYPQGHEWAGMPVPNMAAQAREMGRLEGRLSATQAAAAAPVIPPKKVSKAPAPVTPVSQRATATERKGDELTADEYYEAHASTRARKAAAAKLGATHH